eukprot:TRINITY_DN5075_c1_g1_i1.p2 TRINITY_DN5075_c1_g1~~TRINITY_DN5075_c1_g1_i1.p2  ORF type:complete len:157 (-),score=51.07 TRINITY_DN5075_c1_g1_i1:379-849(-)
MEQCCSRPLLFWMFFSGFLFFFFGFFFSLDFQPQSKTEGIEKLLQAEAEASAIVSEARKQKDLMMKRAHDEASDDVQSYRQKMEEEFENYKSDYAGESGSTGEKMKQQMIADIAEVEDLVAKNKQDVIELLLNTVQQVDTTIPKNVQTYLERTKDD